MSVRIRMGFVVIMVTILALGACQQAAGPGDEAPPAGSAVNEAVFDAGAGATGIARILIASVEMQALAFTEDPNVISEVSNLLTGTELATLVSRRLVRVEDPSAASTIAMVVGLDIADPAMTEEGLLVTTYSEVTWGKLKCCFKDPNCCPKKKKEQ
jgi:hypothetical protein